MEQFTVFTTQIALEADSHGNSHPISVVVKDPNEISAIFDSISYNKVSYSLQFCFFPPLLGGGVVC